MMRWILLMKVGPHPFTVLCRRMHIYHRIHTLSYQGARKWARKFTLNQVRGRNLSDRTVNGVPWSMWMLLGCGVLGGALVSLVKYYKSDRTARAVTFDPTTSHTVLPESGSKVTATEVAVQQFGVLQRFYLVIRFFYLFFLFSPAVLLFGVSYLLGSSTIANFSWKYALFAVQSAGPAFIKLGQWASTRRDIFSEDFCTTLSQLHIFCTPHTWQETVKVMDVSLGRNWQDKLIIVNHTPIGSGCVAQVYKGHMYVGDDNGNCIPIAVKVLHPNIVDRMARDIYLMKYVASWVDVIYPDVHWVALKECVDEFSFIMERQLDLEQEAKNLCRFRNNSTDCHHINFPTPIYPYVTKEVLVESFEPGEHISAYMDNPGGKLQKCLAKIGIEILLDMLFVHNFVHGDLHPGNILVQGPNNITEPKMVLLDCGIATSLTPHDLENLLCVFTAIVTNQGWKVADLFLAGQTCPTLEEYRREVGTLINTAVLKLNLKEVRVDTLFSNLFDILINHKVRIDPSFTSVMVAIMVTEGLGRSLDPNLDILDYARPYVLQKAKQSIRESVSYRLQNISEAILAKVQK